MLGKLIPVPGVSEGANLRARLLARLVAEQDVVRRVRVERRVEVDEVDGLRRDVVAQDSQVVAEVRGGSALRSPPEL
jgi:hypothetical protein